MEFKDQLKLVINSLADSVTKENNEENQEVFEQLKVMFEKDPRSFLSALKIGQSKFEMLVSEVFEVSDKRKKYLLKYISNGLYEHFHRERVTKLEGMGCCADKSSFIQRMTIKALQTGENLSLFADYQNVDQIKEGKERQAYWSPETVKDTDEAIKLFWDWYRLADYK